jgi:ribonuclease III-like protein
MDQAELKRVLVDRNLAQLGDSILNFALSAALTKVSSRPTGRRVKNSLMTPLIDSSALKPLLPLRTSKRDRANAFEALAGYLWKKKAFKIEELIDVMAKPRDSVDDSEFERLSLQAAFNFLVDRVEADRNQVTIKT